MNQNYVLTAHAYERVNERAITELLQEGRQRVHRENLEARKANSDADTGTS
jgi:hypothetical protein